MTLVRLAGALLAAGCTMLVLCSLGAPQARSSTGCNGASPGFNLDLGLDNTCNWNTYLYGNSATPLSVVSTAGSGTVTAFYGHATAFSGPATGVAGQTESSGNSSFGVYGALNSTIGGDGSAGVFGESLSTNAQGYGVWGHHGGAGTAPGVLGQTDSTAANAIGTEGLVNSTSPGSGSAAVRGINNGTNANGYGVWGSHAGGGTGVYGLSASGIGLLGIGGNVGVLGYNPNANGFAGYFLGNLAVTGTLYKGAGAFRIDHPLDPAHAYLQHSFVESPDMMNVYNGNVTTNARGFATVRLPAYFQALNKDFRYQLTVLGRSFAQAIVAKEIQHNQFTIRTNKPNVKVSWQVTGIRHDPYANAHRIQVLVPKEGSADGKYVHSELYGKPLSKSVVVLRGMTHTQPRFRTAAAPAQK